jgi:hypothetical protein
MRMPRLCIPQPESSPIDTTEEQMQAIGARDRIESASYTPILARIIGAIVSHSSVP